MSEMSANPRPTVIQTSSDYPEAPTTSASESECHSAQGPAGLTWRLTFRPSRRHSGNVRTARRDTPRSYFLPICN
jgi:hypothetical protein